VVARSHRRRDQHRIRASGLNFWKSHLGFATHLTHDFPIRKAGPPPVADNFLFWKVVSSHGITVGVAAPGSVSRSLNRKMRFSPSSEDGEKNMADLNKGIEALAQALLAQEFRAIDEFDSFVTFEREGDPAENPCRTRWVLCRL
jgi:hypothetical protein